MRRLSILLILGLMTGSSCYLLEGDGSLAVMTLRVDRGSVRVIRAGESVTVEKQYTLRSDDQVETLDHSRATLRLHGDRQAELGPEARVTVVDGDSLNHHVGSVLAVADDAMSVRFGGITAQGKKAAFRVDRAFAARVAAYRGRVEVRAPGSQSEDVGPLYETSTAGDQVARISPYHLNVFDPWDQRYLGDTIALEQQLRRFASGLESQLGRDRPDARFFEAMAKRNVSFVRSELYRRSVSDLLIGFAVSLSAPMNARQAFAQGFDLFDQGASWGIVAGIMDVDAGNLVARLDGIVSDIRVVRNGTGRKANFRIARADPNGEDKPGTGADDEPKSGSPGDEHSQPPKEPSDPPPTTEPTPTPTPTPCASLTECLLENLLPLDPPNLTDVVEHE